MAQFAKDEIRQRILDAAREEFLDKGYEKAAIRAIAVKAQTAKSNLYNYFADKDALFNAVLEPAVSEIRRGLALARQYNVPKGVEAYTLDTQRFVIGAIGKFVATHMDDTRLLLFKSQGSSLQNFKYEVLDDFTDNMLEWTRAIQNAKPVSRLFIRSICSFYLGLIEQILQSVVPLSGTPAEMEVFMKEISVFVYHGWKNVLS